MPEAARIGDHHECPATEAGCPHVGGSIIAGCQTVLIGGMPAARVKDAATCVGAEDAIIIGEPTVLIGGRASARKGDVTKHGGLIQEGCPTVLIGSEDGAEKTWISIQLVDRHGEPLAGEEFRLT